jgi:hypothetical protein
VDADREFRDGRPADRGPLPQPGVQPRRALILDADGYQTPVISPDGRYLAIRGNSYENSLEVFEFPSLTRVFATVLGEPHRSGKYDPDWDRQYRAWSRHNIAFGVQPSLLWVGTPAGTPDHGDLEDHLDATDGTRTWEPGHLKEGHHRNRVGSDLAAAPRGRQPAVHAIGVNGGQQRRA